MRLIVIAAAVAVTLLAVWWAMQDRQGGDAVASIVVPELSAEAEQGREAFEANCVRCHGPNATGSEKGPPLIHPVYEPSHHADLAFLMAVQRGVRAHHWDFGPMPPVHGVSDAEVEQIVAYVRELQRANGIE